MPGLARNPGVLIATYASPVPGGGVDVLVYRNGDGFDVDWSQAMDGHVAKRQTWATRKSAMAKARRDRGMFDALLRDHGGRVAVPEGS
jgi:hypothetical protein